MSEPWPNLARTTLLRTTLVSIQEGDVGRREHQANPTTSTCIHLDHRHPLEGCRLIVSLFTINLGVQLIPRLRHLQRLQAAVPIEWPTQSGSYTSTKIGTMVGALHSSPEEKAASAAARRAAFIAQERQEAGASEQGSWESKDQATPEGTVSQMQQSMAALGLQTSVQSKSRCATGTLSSPGDASPSPSSSPPEPTAPSSSLADAVQTSSLIPPSPPIPMAMVASEFDGREGGCVSPSSTPYADSLKTFSSLATPYADSLKTFSSSSFLSLPLPWARDEALEKRKGGNEKVEARSASHGDESRTQGGEPSYSTLQRRCSEAEAAAQVHTANSLARCEML